MRLVSFKIVSVFALFVNSQVVTHGPNNLVGISYFLELSVFAFARLNLQWQVHCAFQLHIFA